MTALYGYKYYKPWHNISYAVRAVWSSSLLSAWRRFDSWLHVPTVCRADTQISLWGCAADLSLDLSLGFYRKCCSLAHILRTAEGFEKCSQNEGRVGYLHVPLKSNISNWFDPAFFPTFSLSFSPFSFVLSCAFRMLGHLSRPKEGHLIGWCWRDCVTKVQQ